MDVNYNKVLDELRLYWVKRMTNWKVDESSGITIGKGYLFRPEAHDSSKSLEPLGNNGNCIARNSALYKEMSAKTGGSNIVFMVGEFCSFAGECASVDSCRGLPGLHCWVEVVSKGDITVYDNTNGMLIAKKDIYYLLKRIKRSEPVLSTEQLIAYQEPIIAKQRLLGYHFKNFELGPSLDAIIVEPTYVTDHLEKVYLPRAATHVIVLKLMPRDMQIILVTEGIVTVSDDNKRNFASDRIVSHCKGPHFLKGGFVKGTSFVLEREGDYGKFVSLSPESFKFMLDLVVKLAKVEK